ncbi:hypothetical protein BDW22DRAFT_978214 [Trametopsis cervina]|nr:hypothetical protein BDW22DRAFT_978214 [Trametopsis cervina]
MLGDSLTAAAVAVDSSHRSFSTTRNSAARPSAVIVCRRFRRPSTRYHSNHSALFSCPSSNAVVAARPHTSWRSHLKPTQLRVVQHAVHNLLPASYPARGSQHRPTWHAVCRPLFISVSDSRSRVPNGLSLTGPHAIHLATPHFILGTWNDKGVDLFLYATLLDFTADLFDACTSASWLVRDEDLTGCTRVCICTGKIYDLSSISERVPSRPSPVRLLALTHASASPTCASGSQKMPRTIRSCSSPLRSVDVAYNAHTQTRKHVRVVHLALAREFLQRNVMGRWTRLRSTCMQGPCCGLLGSVRGTDPSVYAIVLNIAVHAPSTRNCMDTSTETRARTSHRQRRHKVPAHSRPCVCLPKTKLQFAEDAPDRRYRLVSSTVCRRRIGHALANAMRTSATSASRVRGHIFG